MVGPVQLRRSRHRYTYDEYLAYERDSALEYEYVDASRTATRALPQRA